MRKNRFGIRMFMTGLMSMLICVTGSLTTDAAGKKDVSYASMHTAMEADISYTAKDTAIADVSYITVDTAVEADSFSAITDTAAEADGFSVAMDTAMEKDGFFISMDTAMEDASSTSMDTAMEADGFSASMDTAMGENAFSIALDTAMEEDASGAEKISGLASRHRESYKKDTGKRKPGCGVSKKPQKQKTVVLAGSSSIEYWKKAPSVLDPLKTVNAGVAGSTSEEWLGRYFRRITKYRPDAVVLYIGGNDIMRSRSGSSGQETAGRICRLLARLRKSLPGVPVYYVSIAPSQKIWPVWNQARKCNRIVSRFCSRYRGLHFINLARSCLNSRGELKKGLYRADGLHFNQKGYKIWNKAVAQKVKKDLCSG